MVFSFRTDNKQVIVQYHKCDQYVRISCPDVVHPGMTFWLATPEWDKVSFFWTEDFSRRRVDNPSQETVVRAINIMLNAPPDCSQLLMIDTMTNPGIYTNGTKFWYQNDLLHRDAGPAII